MSIQKVLPKKSLGILMHPSSIPGGYGCGTFGRGAKEWIKKLHKHGIEYWQFLPLTPTDSAGSPYSSPSSFALNPWFLDINELIEKRFVFISKEEELGIKKQNQNNSKLNKKQKTDSKQEKVRLGLNLMMTMWVS